MAKFLWHLRGSVVLDGGPSNEAALRRVKRLLKQQQKPVSEEGADFVAFYQPLWRDWGGPNWVALVLFDRGRFWIEYGVNRRWLRYDLRSLHSVILSAFVAVVVFIAGFADGGPMRGMQWSVGAFAWLYGVNLLLAAIRVPLAVRRALRGP